MSDPKDTLQREELIDTLVSVDELRERLKAAERACILSGWYAAPDRSRARGRLAYKAWSDWYDLVGGEKLAGPRANADIAAEMRREEARDKSFETEAAVLVPAQEDK